MKESQTNLMDLDQTDLTNLDRRSQLRHYVYPPIPPPPSDFSSAPLSFSPPITELSIAQKRAERLSPEMLQQPRFEWKEIRRPDNFLFACHTCGGYATFEILAKSKGQHGVNQSGEVIYNCTCKF